MPHLSHLDDDDAVGPLHRAQAVRDQDDRHPTPRDHVVDGLLHQVLALRVQRAATVIIYSTSSRGRGPCRETILVHVRCYCSGATRVA